jgi:hypothetical protein
MKKQLDADHLAIYQRFQEKNNLQGKLNVERKYSKKRSLVSNSSIFEFFASKDLIKKDDVEQKNVYG